jgi:hypothetical protein
MMADWQEFPAGSWRWMAGLLQQGSRSGRHFGASYALVQHVPSHLNGRVRATLNISDWRNTGCAGIVFRASTRWSMNCAYVYAPSPNEGRVLLRFAEYTEGGWRRLADSDDEITIVDATVQFSLEYRAGRVACEITSGPHRMAMTRSITTNPFPGRVGVVRFYNCLISVQSFYVETQESLPELRRVEPARSEPAESILKPVHSPRTPVKGDVSQAITLLFLAANPSDQARLGLTTEIKKLDERLRATAYRDAYDIAQHWDVEVTELQRLILRHKPQIVHFSGHGKREGQLVFQDARGASSPIPVELIANTFRILGKYVRCVVLNACFSRTQADAIVKNVEAVVGMDSAILDVDAIEFSCSFYEALGYGEDLKTAFDLACNAIGIRREAASSVGAVRDIQSAENTTGVGREDIPQLLVRADVDPATIRFVPRS